MKFSKKSIYWIVGTIVLVLVVVVLCLVFKSSFFTVIKTLESHSNLTRDVTVINSVDNSVIWNYSGNCLIDDNSGNGNVSILYYENKKPKKIDFFGSNAIIIANEK